MRHIFTLTGISLWIVLSMISCDAGEKQIDLALINGKFYTVSDSGGNYSAIGITGDKIKMLGSDKEIKAAIGPSTKTIDLNAKFVFPGFIDAHAHFMNLGYYEMRLKFKDTKSWAEILAMVKNEVNKRNAGVWIRGRGWHQEKWEVLPSITVEGYPVHNSLSDISPDHPVCLKHESGHAILVNKKAMDLAGITHKTKDPPGGRIIRDKRGNPTGVFLEDAKNLIDPVISESRKNLNAADIEDEDRRAFQFAVQACLSNWITSFHDAGASFKRINFYKKLVDENKAPVRLWVMIGEENDSLLIHLSDYKIINYGNNNLTVRSIKSYMDGALGSRGAWMLKPYTDQSSTSGLHNKSLSGLRQTAQFAIENDFQLCLHAIGDRANRETLDIYEDTFKQYPEKKNLRWRVEHAQHLHPDDIPRFDQLGVIAAVQSIHCTSDAPWVPKRLGNKRAREGAYVWRKLINSGAILCNGTDTPVENIDPFANFYAAITRKTSGHEAFYPKQRLSREEALRSFTIDAAYAAFEEDIKGTLTTGKLADIIVLSNDIMTIPEENILKTEVLYTIVGGRVVYQK